MKEALLGSTVGRRGVGSVREYILRTLATFVLALPVWSQTTIPDANFELVLGDLSELIQTSASLPMNAVLHDPAMEIFVEAWVGKRTGSELMEAALSGLYPGGSRWQDFAPLTGEVRVRGHVQSKSAGFTWVVVQLTAKNEAVAAQWSESLAPKDKAGVPQHWLPRCSHLVGHGIGGEDEGMVFRFGYGDTPPASIAMPPGERLGPDLLQPKPGNVPMLEAHGRFGSLFQTVLPQLEMAEAVSGWLSGIGDSDAHMIMEATFVEPGVPGRVLTRIRWEENAPDSIVGVQPLKLASLRGLPDTAMFVSTTTVDTERAMKKFLGNTTIVRKVLEAKLGFPLRRMLDRLGPNLRTWSDRTSGMQFPPTLMRLEARDATQMYADLTSLLDLASALDSDIEGLTQDYAYSDAASGEPMITAITEIRSDAFNSLFFKLGEALHPAVCLHDGSLFIASSSERMKRMLRTYTLNRAGGELDFAQQLAHHGLRGAATVWSFDYIKLMDGLLSVDNPDGGLAEALPHFDLTLLPSPHLLDRHLRPTFHAQGVDEMGCWIVHESSFGPETWPGLCGFGQLALMKAYTEYTGF